MSNKPLNPLSAWWQRQRQAAATAADAPPRPRPAWLARLRRDKATPPVDEAPSTPAEQATPSQTLKVGPSEFAFGLKWALVDDKRQIDKALKEAAKQGYTHHVLAGGQMLGLAVLPATSKKTMSAAVCLAESTSLGGQELFVFELRENVHALIALNDNLPLSHFDQTGEPEHVMALVQEFFGLYPGQSLRTVGNVPVASNTEPLPPKEAFVRPDNAALLKPIPNYKFRRLMLVLVLPSVLVFAAVAGWLQWQQQKAEEERIAREQDPNYIYENAVTPALQQVGPQAQVLLDQWRQAIVPLPMAQVGWTLKKIVCEPGRCKTTWQRDFGSYEDFHDKSRPEWTSIHKVQTGDNPAQASIDATLTLPPLAQTQAPAGLKRTDLQPMADTLKQVASTLQDLSLIPRTAVMLKASELYPTTGAQVEQINMPVVKGEWGIKHDLWTLGQLQLLHPHVVLQSLTVEQDDKTKQWTYALTGHYYAKGKNF